MPKTKETSEPMKADLGSALAGLVHAGQGVRRAARGRAVDLAQEALSTTAKAVGALKDL